MTTEMKEIRVWEKSKCRVINIRLGHDGFLGVVDEEGVRGIDGSICYIDFTGRLCLCEGLDPDVGLQVDAEGKIVIANP